MTAVLLLLGKLWASPGVRKALLVAGLVVAAVAVPWTTYRTGLSRGASRMHAADVEHERAAVAAADAKYRTEELANAKRIEAIRVEYASKQATENAVDSRVGGDLLSGRQRVRVQVARCSTSAATPGPTAARADVPETAELAPEVAAGLYAIAADCDETARELGALQAWARSAVTLCNGQPPK